ncbi:MAG: type IV pilus twitching motility protein PilT [Lachnospiraceae bacterium]|nr:type IV pilus twitching motility protein PilT [Lachnospiraceae bacterium]
MNINQLIEYARSQSCSDIHITQEGEIAIRRYGKLAKLDGKFDPADLDKLIYSMFDEDEAKAFTKGEDIDFSYQTPGTNIRCRVNAYHQRASHAACLRIMGDKVPIFESLRLPHAIKKFADLPRGLVLVTGPTGSGKSTTLASLIDYINSTRAEHIITIEDPIEYMYTPGVSTIHQREIGRDVETFAGALRSALREDPDVILVGEMRDFETISAAITAAETGHLVFSTLHTTGAADTVNRIIDVFPPHSQNQIRTQLAAVLEGVVTQNLIPLADGTGRIAATEVMVCNDAISNLIRTDKTHQIDSHMQTGQKEGMHTLNMDLKALVRGGKITKELALKRSNNPLELLKDLG